MKLPKDFVLLEETDVKNIEGGCNCNSPTDSKLDNNSRRCSPIGGLAHMVGNVIGGTLNVASNVVGGTLNAAGRVVGGTLNVASNIVGCATNTIGGVLHCGVRSITSLFCR